MEVRGGRGGGLIGVVRERRGRGRGRGERGVVGGRGGG